MVFCKVYRLYAKNRLLNFKRYCYGKWFKKSIVAFYVHSYVHKPTAGLTCIRTGDCA